MGPLKQMFAIYEPNDKIVRNQNGFTMPFANWQASCVGFNVLIFTFCTVETSWYDFNNFDYWELAVIENIHNWTNHCNQVCVKTRKFARD